MKKRTLTAEQTAARDARREKFRQLCRKVKAMSLEEQAKWQGAAAGVLTVDGHTLSGHNLIMCYLQNPTVTVVGGFRQWLKAGRAVRKGEHGMTIWVPMGCKKAAEGVDETSADEGDGHQGFILGTVFDVLQTDEVTVDAPIAVVSPEIADAFGMAGLPNVRVVGVDA